jgi:hypothetical protein
MGDVARYRCGPGDRPRIEEKCVRMRFAILQIGKCDVLEMQESGEMLGRTACSKV